MDRDTETKRHQGPTTVADITVAEDGDILISFEDAGISGPKGLELMLSQFGIQVVYKKTVRVDLHIPLRNLREKLKDKPSVILAQVKGDGNIQVFDNVPFVEH